MSETSDITSPLIEAINGIPGCIATRQHAGSVRVRRGYLHLGPKGWPDVSVVVHGRAVYIETKTERGRLKPEQIECHRRLGEAGASVFVCRSVREGLARVNEIRRVLV